MNTPTITKPRRSASALMFAEAAECLKDAIYIRFRIELPAQRRALLRWLRYAPLSALAWFIVGLISLWERFTDTVVQFEDEGDQMGSYGLSAAILRNALGFMVAAGILAFFVLVGVVLWYCGLWR